MKDYNIILINLDGFREDKIDSCTKLKSFKDRSFYFSKMNTVAPYTFASLHAIFSGMYPSRNGVNAYYNMFKFKKNDIITIPQLLQRAGYYTSCDIISPSAMPLQGYDEWNQFDEATVNFEDRHKDLIKKLSKKEKFFLFLHYTEIHKRLVREIVQKYKQEDNDDDFFKSIKDNNERFNSYIPLCDSYVDCIVKALKENGIADKTILIFFSDHGTSVGEKKGEKFYGVFVYDYTLKVFCILNFPQTSGKVINTQCRTIDIFPTIAEIAGIYLDEEFSDVQGESLFSLINNPSAKEREVFVETGGLYGPWPSPEKHNVFCVKINNKKLIYNDTPKTWEYYDLKEDPNELKNLYDKNSKDVIYLKERMHSYLTENNIEIDFV